MAHREIDPDALSPEEQLELLDRLWERLGRSPDLFPLTEPQRREIDARSEPPGWEASSFRQRRLSSPVWRRIPSPFLSCIATSVEPE
jgi:hypothetical protein